MKKILVIGCCGSGKSTLAKKIQAKTKLPLIHLDNLYYKPNWEKPEKEEWEKKVAELCKADKWIMDGNYISTLEMRVKEADVVVYLDVSRWVCLYRAVLRVITPSKRQRVDMAAECTERFDWQFYRFIWNFRKTTHPRINAILKEHRDKRIYVLKNNKDKIHFLENL